MALDPRPALLLALPPGLRRLTGAGRRRIEKRVTAKTKATSRAARPAAGRR